MFLDILSCALAGAGIGAIFTYSHVNKNRLYILLGMGIGGLVGWAATPLLGPSFPFVWKPVIGGTFAFFACWCEYFIDIPPDDPDE